MTSDPVRLNSLRRTALLDSPTEESFDRLTRLAARVLRAPVALVSLVDDEREFFKSQCGLPEPWASRREIPLTHSFSWHAVAAGEPLVVEDARVHPLVHDNPAVHEIGVVAYLGVPLIAADGAALGSACVIDHAPRAWTEDEVRTLTDIARAVVTEIELRIDTTERDRIAAELHATVERYRLVMKATNDTIWELDLTTGEGRWSEGIQTMFGYTADEVLPTDDWWSERIHPDDRERTIASSRAAIAGTGSSWTGEYRFRHADGSYVSVLDRAYIARDEEGRAVRIVGSMADVTERQRAEQERERLLQREREARNEAEQANRAKSDFLAVMSHELRTPLTAIMGYADLLLSGIPVPIPEKAQSQVERIDYAAKHLLELIEQILTFSRIEGSHEDLQLVDADLCRVADEAVTLIEPLAAKQGLCFVAELPDAPVLARTDPGKVRQILINLLSNAVKFTPAGTVSLELRTEGDQAAFVVRDTGVGIQPEHVDKIFEPFWQAQQGNTREVSGTGLGLPVCRKLADILGGQVLAESTFGVGTTFVLRFPLRQPG